LFEFSANKEAKKKLEEEKGAADKENKPSNGLKLNFSMTGTSPMTFGSSSSLEGGLKLNFGTSSST
jgi:hypothetical protein